MSTIHNTNNAEIASRLNVEPEASPFFLASFSCRLFSLFVSPIDPLSTRNFVFDISRLSVLLCSLNLLRSSFVPFELARRSGFDYFILCTLIDRILLVFIPLLFSLQVSGFSWSSFVIFVRSLRFMCAVIGYDIIKILQ